MQEQLQAGELGEEQQGLVIAHYGSQLDIEPLHEKGALYRCNLRANLPPLVTGDNVIWRAGADLTGVVVAAEDRQSELCRPDSRGQLKAVAANIDYIIQVIAPLPMPHRSLIDRYLVASEAVDIEPVILFNKIDLLNGDNRREFEELLGLYEKIGYRVIHASATGNEGLQEIKELLKDHTSVFVGQSGVGKSSLINALLPGVDIRVGALSEQHNQGVHTTTAAKLFHFPGGGDLIDSPGIREFGLWHIDQATLIDGFREFRPFLGYCRFRDCQHQHEPGCAILQAIEDGDISEQRMNSYRRILISQDSP